MADGGRVHRQVVGGGLEAFMSRRGLEGTQGIQGWQATPHALTLRVSISH